MKLGLPDRRARGPRTQGGRSRGRRNSGSMRSSLGRGSSRLTFTPALSGWARNRRPWRSSARTWRGGAGVLCAQLPRKSRPPAGELRGTCRRHAPADNRGGLRARRREVVSFSGCPGEPGGQYPNWITTPWPGYFDDLLEWQWAEQRSRTGPTLPRAADKVYGSRSRCTPACRSTICRRS